MKASLVLRQRLDPGTRYAISSDSLILGRNDDNDVVLDSPRVSRYHARIAWTGAEYHLEDLGSKNGTSLNGRRVTEASPLRDGDLIGIGDLLIAFEVQGLETITMPEDGGIAHRSDGLTRREAEILIALADGDSNHEIAEALVLSVRTVERHVSNIYGKLGVRNRSEATAYALQNQLMR